MSADDVVTGARYAMTACAVVATVENLLALVVFASTSRLRMKYYGFLINLTLADLFYAVMAIAFTWQESEIVFSIFFSGYFVGIFTILAEGINRYLAVSFLDARYDVLVTRNRLVAVCVLIWVIPISVNVLLTLLPDSDFAHIYEGLIRPVAVFGFWLITAGLYIAIFWMIKMYTASLPSTSPPLQTACKGDRVRTRMHDNRRSLATFSFILVVSFFSWIPISVMFMIAHIHRELEYQEAVFWITAIIYCLAPMINPWIYGMRLEAFREGIRHTFCRCFNREVIVDEAVTETGL